MATTDRLNGVQSSLAVKAPCRVATTAAITLAALQTVDGVALAAGDRVLVKDQASAIANGIYNAGTGTWERALDFDGTRDVVGGTWVFVVSGTANPTTFWTVSGSGAKTPGTDSISFTAGVTSAGAASYLQAGTGAVSRTAQTRLRERVSVKDFGAVGDGATDDYAAVVLARTYAVANNYELVFPAGVYALSQTLELGYTYFRVRGEGYCVLKHTGSGTKVISQDGGVGAIVYGCQIENFVIRGNGTASQSGLYRRNVPHGVVRGIRVYDVLGKAFDINGDVLTHYDTCVCSDNGIGAFTYNPTHGFYVTGTALITSTVACTFTNCAGEKGTTAAWELDNAGHNVWNGGTGEAVTGIGLIIGANCLGDTFNNFFCESNTGGDMTLFGTRYTFINCSFNTSTTTAVIVKSGAATNNFINSRGNAITVDSGATDTDIGRSSLWLTVTNNGTRTGQERRLEYTATTSSTLRANFSGNATAGTVTLSTAAYTTITQKGLLVHGEAFIDASSISSTPSTAAAISNVFPTGASPHGLVDVNIGRNTIAIPSTDIDLFAYRSGTEAFLRLNTRATMSGNGIPLAAMSTAQAAYVTWQYQI